MTTYKILCVPCAKNADRIYEQHLPHIKRRALWAQNTTERHCDECRRVMKIGDPCYTQTTWEKGDKEPDRWEDRHVELITTKDGKPVEAREL